MHNSLNALALEIDTAAQQANIPALEALVKKCDDALAPAQEQDVAILHFLKANCFGALALACSVDPEYEWSWQQSERISEILCLRKSVIADGFPNLDPVFQCKILTNLGNSLDRLGRFIAALGCWDEAIKKIDNFAMALGNKGVGIIHYSQHLYDYGHAGVLLAHANVDLEYAISEEALWDSGLHPEARDYFNRYHKASISRLEKIQYDYTYDLDQWPLGESDDEVEYRGWCLHYRLFLSPLNDVCRYTAAAQDVIHLPNHTYKLDERPCFPNYFNLLKQEFVTSRYLIFKALKNEAIHYSDKDVLLMDGFDGAQYGYRCEQLKMAYRMLYSLFDKVALFINGYFSVGLTPGSVNFRNIWGKKKNNTIEFYPCFNKTKNWPLRGLYYLSQDLFDKDFYEVALPDAQELASLRNRIEHRFLSIQDFPCAEENTQSHTYIEFRDFEGKTMRLAAMVREALIYLSLAMHREETIRRQDDDGVPYVSVPSIPIN